MKNGMNEKRECYFTENKIREKKGETREKERGKEGKKRILMENAEIMNTMKGLDAKYQNIYLNFVKANKKKNQREGFKEKKKNWIRWNLEIGDINQSPFLYTLQCFWL